jgi:predicted unusual protein kinase regulating ubiquinone biosynthesis (AarF/ABC1/UbiB family)
VADYTQEDESRLSGRLKRYAHVSTQMGGSVFQLLIDRVFGHTSDPAKQAKALTDAMGHLKGPVMKIAQMLATIPDAVPPEYALEFLSLQADAPAMGWPFVKRRMQSELGSAWETKFQNFSHHAVAAASLGQVHQAQSHTGELLACKLQYPDMASIVDADLRQLKMALRVYEATLGGIKTEEIFKELSERLNEELDYSQEAQNMELYRTILKPFNFIHIPHVHEDLSTKRLLTMSWLEGKRLKDILDAPQEFRNLIAERMFIGWYYPFYQHHVIHGDPHLGNYTFTADGHVNLLDFGCIRHFEPQFIQGVLDLYQALKTKDQALAVHAYETWGFTNLTHEMLDVLNMWAQLLYEPILDDRVRPIQEGNSGVYGREIADKVHTELRRLGGIKPPREFVFMDRAAVGVGSVCMHLRAELNWAELFRQVSAQPDHNKA